MEGKNKLKLKLKCLRSKNWIDSYPVNREVMIHCWLLPKGLRRQCIEPFLALSSWKKA